MSVDTWKLEKDLCRCCHSEGAFKNLAEPFKHLGQEEIYSEMLQECLDINLNPVAGPLCAVTYKICEECILRIREACSFKRQVLDCEQRFHDLYGKKILQLTSFSDKIEVKKEVPDIELEEDTKGEIHFMDNEDNGLGVGYNDDVTDHKTPLLEIDIKSEVPKKSRQKKAKTKERAKDKAKKKVGRPRKVKEEGERSEQKKGDDSQKPACPIITQVDGAKQYGCNVCQKVFKKRVLYSQHFRHVHLKLRPKLRSCYYCDVKVPGNDRAKHLEEVHGVPRPVCNACGKKFSYPHQVLQHHKRFHMHEKLYECTKCNRMFTLRSQLTRHEITHSGIRPHKCEFCGKAFRWKKNLKTHVMIHTNERKYACILCGEAFVQQTSLKYHVMKKHPNLM